MKCEGWTVYTDMAESLPSRGAWIEMPNTGIPSYRAVVAPLSGGMD